MPSSKNLTPIPRGDIILKRADFTNLKLYFSAAFFGKRRTGKTTWAKILLQCVKHMAHRIIVFCGNKDCEGEWLKILPACFVVTKDLDYLQTIVTYQNEIADQYKNHPDGIPLEYRMILIIDDCGSDKQFMHSKVMNDIMANGRHYGMYTVFLLQYFTQLHPQNRCQLDYAGILATNNLKNLKTLHSEYGGNCSLAVFMQIVSLATDGFGVCWVDNTIHVPYDPVTLNVSNLMYQKKSFLTDINIDEPLCPEYIIDECNVISEKQTQEHIIIRASL